MSAPEPLPRVVCIGVSSFSRPLDPSTRKKFLGLRGLAEFHVAGFASGGPPGVFVEEAATFHLTRRPRWAALRFLRALVHGTRTVWRLGGRGPVDVVVCEDPLIALAGLAARALARARPRAGQGPPAVVTELHGDLDQALVHYVRVPAVLRGPLRRWAAATLRRSQVVRTVSLTLREKYGGGLRPGTPLLVFPTYTDFELFFQPPTATTPAAAPAAPAGPAEPARVLFVGTLAPVKGIDVLIDAFEALARERPGVELVVIGDGPLRDWLLAERDRRGLTSRIHVRGAVPPSAVRDAMAAARLLVLPSRSEGLPRVVLEAMACGRPVVASRVGGLVELVRHGDTGLLVDPEDAPALAGALRTLIDDEPGARAMGLRGRAFVDGRYSTGTYRRAYAEMLAAARATGRA